MAVLSRQHWLRFFGLPLFFHATFRRPDGVILALGERHKVAWRAEQDELVRSDDVFGAAYGDAVDASAALARRLETCQATTIEGLQVLARALLWARGSAVVRQSYGVETADQRLTIALLTSLLAIEGGPAAPVA